MNEAVLPVKSITDFPLEKNKTLTLRLVFWVLFVLFMTAISAVLEWYSVAAHVEFAPWAAVGFLALAFLGMTRVVDLLYETRKSKVESYAAHLASVSTDLLKLVASSPECDQVSKDAVIKHLSATHPGWSLT